MEPDLDTGSSQKVLAPTDSSSAKLRNTASKLEPDLQKGYGSATLNRPPGNKIHYVLISANTGMLCKCFKKKKYNYNLCRLAVSNCGRRIAAVHETGSITIWLLPGLLLESCTRYPQPPPTSHVSSATSVLAPAPDPKI